MEPKVIAEWIDENIGPGRKGTIAEDLYGFRVTPGEHPVDRLLAAIDRGYLDFDPTNPKVQALVKTIYGGEGPSTPEQWEQEIAASTQSNELKQKLKQKLIGMISGVPGQQQNQIGRYKITHKSGKVFVVDEIAHVIGRGGKEMYYVGFGPTTSGRQTSQWNRVKKQAPVFFTRLKMSPAQRQAVQQAGRSNPKLQWNFEHIITINKENVIKITRLGSKIGA